MQAQPPAGGAPKGAFKVKGPPFRSLFLKEILPILIIVGCLVYFVIHLRGGGGGIAGVESLQFDVATAGGDAFTIAAKNIGASDQMIRVDGTVGGQDMIIVLNGAEREAWVCVAGTWTDLSSSFSIMWDQWNKALQDYQACLSGWTGGTWQSSDGTITISNIQVNPSLSESMFTGGGGAGGEGGGGGGGEISQVNEVTPSVKIESVTFVPTGEVESYTDEGYTVTSYRGYFKVSGTATLPVTYSDAYALEGGITRYVGHPLTSPDEVGSINEFYYGTLSMKFENSPWEIINDGYTILRTSPDQPATGKWTAISDTEYYDANEIVHRDVVYYSAHYWVEFRFGRPFLAWDITNITIP
jgi:hypothetical protein